MNQNEEVKGGALLLILQNTSLANADPSITIQDIVEQQQTKHETLKKNDDLKSPNLSSMQTEKPQSTDEKRLHEVELQMQKMQIHFNQTIESLACQIKSIEEKQSAPIQKQPTELVQPAQQLAQQPAQPQTTASVIASLILQKNLSQQKLIKPDEQLTQQITQVNTHSKELDTQLQHINDRCSTIELRFVVQDQMIRELGNKDSSFQETLKELSDIKLDSPTIAEGLQKSVTQYLQEKYFKNIERSLMTAEKEALRLERKQESDLSYLKAINVATGSRFEENEAKITKFTLEMQNEMSAYVQVKDYDQATEENQKALQACIDTLNDTLVSKIDFLLLVQKCETFSSRDTSSQLLKQIAELRELARSKLAYIDDVVKVDKQIREYCAKSFCRQEIFEAQQGNVDAAILKMRKLSHDLDLSLREITQSFDHFKFDVNSKMDTNMEKTTKSIDKLNLQLQRFALIEDFKDLEKRFIPALRIVQGQLETFEDDHNKNTLIIQGFDQRQAQYAMKYEIIEYGKQLRNFLVRDDYFLFKFDAEAQLKKLQDTVDSLVIQARDKAKNDSKEMRQIIRTTMLAHQAKQSAEKEGGSIDKDTVDLLKHLAKNMTQILKEKAEVSDIKELNTLKSNKLDTEHLMRCVDVLYKQMENVCVLVTQIFRGTCDTRKSTEYANIKNQEFLLGASQSLVEWIQKFDPTTSNVMPPNLMAIHAFTDHMRDKSHSPESLQQREHRQSSLKVQQNDLGRAGRNMNLWASQSFNSKFLPRLTNQNVLSLDRKQNISSMMDSNQSLRQASNTVMRDKINLSQTLDGIQLSSVNLANKFKRSGRKGMFQTATADSQTPLKYDFTPKSTSKLQKVTVVQFQQQNDSIVRFEHKNDSAATLNAKASDVELGKTPKRYQESN